MSTTRLRDTGLVLLVAAAAMLGGCAISDDGPPVTQQRDVGDFSVVDVSGAATLDVLVGPAATLSLTGSQKTLDAVEARVVNGTLVVKRRGMTFWTSGSGPLQIRLTAPQLKSLGVNGAGKVSVNGLAGGELALQINGAGELEATGTLDSLSVSMNGAGNMDLSRLVTNAATVTVNGAGNLEVNATGSLVATVNGVGNVRYLGKPAQVHPTINGVGSISPR